jgi:DNA-binding MarR family transcriptional regulator
MDERMTELGGQLVVLSARLVREVRRSNSEHPTHLRVLSMLDEYGPSTVGALAQADGCTQPSMTALVTQLTNHGLAERRRYPGDARVVLVAVTEAGSRQLRAIRSAGASALTELISKLDDQDTEALAAALPALHRLMELAGESQDSRTPLPKR